MAHASSMRLRSLALGIIFLSSIRFGLDRWDRHVSFAAPGLRCTKPVLCQQYHRSYLSCDEHRVGCRKQLSSQAKLALGHPIDVNTASAAALSHVPGLTKAVADQIILYRDAHGPLSAVEHLRHVRGVGPKRFEQAKPHLEVSLEARVAHTASN